MNWDEFFFKLADTVAEKSKDRSTKVGAVIVGPDNEVVSVGFNGFPRGVNDDIASRHARPDKYMWTEHAERNAIYNAARVGVSTKGCSMYVSTMTPCDKCARAIIQAGIDKVIVRCGAWEEQSGRQSRWDKVCEVGLTMLREAGVGMVICPQQ